MAAIAANIVTNANSAIAGANAGSGTPGDVDDIFAAMLDEIAQGLTAGDGMAAAANDGNAAIPAGSLTDATGDNPPPAVATLPAAIADLRSRYAAATTDGADVDAKADKTDAVDCDAPAPSADPGNPSLAQMLALQQTVAAATLQSTATPMPAGPAANVRSDAPADPTLLPGGVTPASGTPAPKTARANAPADPSQIGTDLSASTTSAASAPAQTNTPAPQTGDALPQASVTPEQLADVLAANAPATNAVASPMVANGATQKPAKAQPTAADDAKAQPQRSTAAALAAVSNAASRVFTDQQASSPHVLPPRAGTDLDKNGGQSNNSSSNPQNGSAATQPAAASAPTAEPAATPAAAIMPVHNQPAPQADVTAATPALTSAATAAPAAHAPAQISAQLQVLQSDPHDATPNVAALAVTIAIKSGDGARHFDIRLDPPELGRVDVRLTVDDAGKAQAALAVEKPQTLALLQKDSTHLERALKDAGLDLSQNGLSFSLKGQQQQNGNNGNMPGGRSRQLAVRAIVAADATASALSTAGVSSSDTRLDIRV